jgi:predicted nuclease of predicted toxin-antitoxin system
MRLLFDQNLSFRLSEQLIDLFPDSSQARLLALAEADDLAVWAYEGTWARAGLARF